MHSTGRRGGTTVGLASSDRASKARAPWALALLASAALAPRGAHAKIPPSAVAKAAASAVLPSPEAFVSFDVRDAANGDLIPCKLTFVGVDRTPDPAFTRNDIARQESDTAIAAYNRVMALSGVGYARVPHGIYDVYVSRGIEWDIDVIRHLKVGPQGARISAQLRHVIETDGWISADFHVHAAASSDSHVPMLDRVYEFVADGVEVITSTDHNVVSDYEPFIREVGAGAYLAGLIGDELTTATWGHFGAFPLSRDLEKVGHGAVPVHGKPSEIFSGARTQTPEVLIDVHHPRLDSEIGYFNLGQVDLRNDKAGREGFSWDFDAIEVMNGYQDTTPAAVDRLMNDWFALLAHGHVVTATGNSDTHHLNFNIGGYPRNYVRVADDRPEHIEPLPLARALKHHRAFFTTAPFVRVTSGGAGIGDLVPAPGGRAPVQIEVQAAPWVDVGWVVLYVNGQETKRWQIPASVAPMRFRAETEVVVPPRAGAPGDAFVVVRVEGARSLTPIVGDGRRFTAYPFALTNPLFLDGDRDGRFTPEESRAHEGAAGKL